MQIVEVQIFFGAPNKNLKSAKADFFYEKNPDRIYLGSFHTNLQQIDCYTIYYKSHSLQVMFHDSLFQRCRLHS